MGKQLNILVLEDNPRDGALMLHELARAGFDARPRRVDTEEEYRASLVPDLDVILADGSMPGMDPARALDILREQGLTVPLIVITGSLTDERAVEFMKRGAADYLLKDRLARLGQAISQVLENRRLADEARRVQEERNRFFQLSLDLICVAGTDGYFKLINPAWEKTLGWTHEELLARPYLDFVHPDDRSTTKREADGLAIGGSTYAFENRYQCKDGSYKWLSWRSTSDPGRGLVYATARDTTEWRRAEADRRLRDRAIQAVSQGIVIADASEPDCPIIFASPGFLRLTGYSAQEVIGRNCRFLQGRATDPSAVASLRESVRDGQACTAEMINYRKDGTPFWNEISISPVRDDDGRLTHFVGVQTDITERRSLEEQFRQAQKMDAFGQLAGGVAHDFNNLLTIINGYSELLLKQIPPDSPTRKPVLEIQKAGQSSAALTRQLLVFSRQQVIVPRVLDLGTVVSDTQKMLRRLIGEDIRQRVTLAPLLWPVKADPGQIEQVILNLVVNARDAMPRGGLLTIETENHGAHAGDNGRFVRLTVTDTGCGMDAATRARIFEPFFTTKGDKGTGLGLATVFGIMKQAGGYIEVESDPGRGTTFRLYFPATEESFSSGKSHHADSATTHGTETVLLVEDDDELRALTNHVLKESGYTVLEARNGHEALEIATRHNATIHLLLTDVVMPGLGGRNTADLVEVLHPETRVLFLSGYTDDAILRHGVQQAEVAFLQKPFTPSALLQRIRDVLDQ